MSPHWKKFIRHAVIVGGLLAVIGYMLGQGFLLAERVYSGGAFVEENERVLWQTPLVMATLGVLMTGSIDLISALLHKPARVAVSAQPSQPGT